MIQQPVSKHDIDRWIGWLSNGRERREFVKKRKSTQALLFTALTHDGLGPTPVNGDVAYGLSLLISGRGDIPEIMQTFVSSELPGMDAALRLYQNLNTESLSEAVSAAAKAVRSIEISNELAFGTIDWAASIANGATRLWPSEPEFKRQQGIVFLAQGRYTEAIESLSAARLGNPELYNLAEPMARVEKIQGDRSAFGEYIDGSIRTFHRHPFLVFMLMVSTLGTYLIYYLIANHRLAQRRLGVPLRPWWAWFGLIIPFFNAYLFYSAFSTIGRRIEGSGGVSRRMVLVIAVLLGVLDATWRLSDPLWFIGALLTAPVLTILHYWLWKAERNDVPGLRSTTSIWEIIIIIVGLLLVAVVAIGQVLPSESAS